LILSGYFEEGYRGGVLMQLAGQLTFDGLGMGVLFVIMACGLVIIASVSRILFMAYGSFYTIGGYATWYSIYYFNFPYFLALIIGVLVAGFLALLSYILIFRRLQNVEDGFLATLIASMGLSLVLSQGGMLIYGTAAHGITTVFPGAIDIAGVHMKNDKIALIIISVLVTIFLFWVYEKTALGRQLRSTAFNPEIASLLGVNVNIMLAAALILGCSLAGLAGGLLAPSYGISPSMGQNVLWTVMLMCMFGGMDSLLGAVVGGLVVGLLLSFGQYYIGSNIQIVVFVVIGILLYFRPNGLLGKGINIGI
jgi:branched-chain amino acid transport system permease protein